MSVICVDLHVTHLYSRAIIDVSFAQSGFSSVDTLRFQQPAVWGPRADRNPCAKNALQAENFNMSNNFYHDLFGGQA
jgi:hypothetical protein